MMNQSALISARLMTRMRMMMMVMKRQGGDVDCAKSL